MQRVCGAAGAAAGWGRPQPQRPHRQVATRKKISSLIQEQKQQNGGSGHCKKTFGHHLVSA